MNILSAAGAATDGFSLIGHDLNGWTVALIAATIAAVVYEVTMALAKMVTLRVPFLMLQVARLVTPRDVRAALYAKWKGELWSILRGKGLWITRFLRGMNFALQLALYGARTTAKIERPDTGRGERPDRVNAISQFMQPLVAVVSLGVSFASLFELSAMARLLVLLISLALGVLVSLSTYRLHRQAGGSIDGM